jgi:hypothetical protein
MRRILATALLSTLLLGALTGSVTAASPDRPDAVKTIKVEAVGGRITSTTSSSTDAAVAAYPNTGSYHAGCTYIAYNAWGQSIYRLTIWQDFTIYFGTVKTYAPEYNTSSTFYNWAVLSSSHSHWRVSRSQVRAQGQWNLAQNVSGVPGFPNWQQSREVAVGVAVYGTGTWGCF